MVRGRARTCAVLPATLLLLLAGAVAPADLPAQERDAACFPGDARAPGAPAVPPGGTRLFLVPTGRTLPDGCGEAGALQFVFPFASYGVTDRLALTAGTPLFFDDAFAFGRFWYGGVKVGLHRSGSVSLAAGGLGVLQLETFDFDVDVFRGLFGYVVGTVGGSDAAATAGVTLQCFAPFGCADLRTAYLFGGEVVLHRTAGIGGSPGALRLIVEAFVFGDRAGPFEGERILALPGLRFEAGRVGLEVVPARISDEVGFDFIDLPLFGFTIAL